jgi:hypothetical protein
MATPIRVFVKPAKEELLIRDPDSKFPLLKEGEWKIKNQFWIRRILSGEVLEVPAPDQPQVRETLEEIVSKMNLAQTLEELSGIADRTKEIFTKEQRAEIKPIYEARKKALSIEPEK